MCRWRKIIVWLALFIIGLPLLFAVQTFPRPVVFERMGFLLPLRQTSLKNGVVALLSVFRPLDTLAGLMVLLGGLMGVLALTGGKEKDYKHRFPYTSSVLSIIMGIFFPLCLVFALYLLVYGFSMPGGGIQAGVMLSAAAILFFLTLGAKRFQKHFYSRYFLHFVSGGLLVFGAGFLLVSFRPALAGPLGILPLESGLAAAVGTILVALFWRLAREEE